MAGPDVEYIANVNDEEYFAKFGDYICIEQTILDDAIRLIHQRDIATVLDYDFNARDLCDCPNNHMPKCNASSQCSHLKKHIVCQPECGMFCRNQSYPKETFAVEQGKLYMGLYNDARENAVFAHENIVANSVICEWVGVWTEIGKEIQSRYSFDIGLPGYVLDASVFASVARVINHSCEPNCKSVVRVVNGEWRIYIIAIRDILSNEEITMGYGTGIGQFKECLCGTPNCIKYLKNLGPTVELASNGNPMSNDKNWNDEFPATDSHKNWVDLSKLSTKLQTYFNQQRPNKHMPKHFKETHSFQFGDKVTAIVLFKEENRLAFGTVLNQFRNANGIHLIRVWILLYNDVYILPKCFVFHYNKLATAALLKYVPGNEQRIRQMYMRQHVTFPEKFSGYVLEKYFQHWKNGILPTYTDAQEDILCIDLEPEEVPRTPQLTNVFYIKPSEPRGSTNQPAAAPTNCTLNEAPTRSEPTCTAGSSSSVPPNTLPTLYQEIDNWIDYTNPPLTLEIPPQPPFNTTTYQPPHTIFPQLLNQPQPIPNLPLPYYDQRQTRETYGNAPAVVIDGRPFYSDNTTPVGVGAAVPLVSPGLPYTHQIGFSNPHNPEAASNYVIQQQLGNHDPFMQQEGTQRADLPDVTAAGGFFYQQQHTYPSNYSSPTSPHFFATLPTLPEQTAGIVGTATLHPSPQPQFGIPSSLPFSEEQGSPNVTTGSIVPGENKVSSQQAALQTTSKQAKSSSVRNSPASNPAATSNHSRTTTPSPIFSDPIYDPDYRKDFQECDKQFTPIFHIQSQFETRVLQTIQFMRSRVSGRFDFNCQREYVRKVLYNLYFNCDKSKRKYLVWDDFRIACAFENPYAVQLNQCSICKDTVAYNSDSALRQHYVENHQIITSLQSCQTCHLEFPYPSTYTQHVQMYHPEQYIRIPINLTHLLLLDSFTDVVRSSDCANNRLYMIRPVLPKMFPFDISIKDPGVASEMERLFSGKPFPWKTETHQKRSQNHLPEIRMLNGRPKSDNIEMNTYKWEENPIYDSIQSYNDYETPISSRIHPQRPQGSICNPENAEVAYSTRPNTAPPALSTLT